MKLVLIFLLLLTGCHIESKPSTTQIHLMTPRPFGYVIGDQITHRIDLTLSSGEELDANSLPMPGNVNYWLSIRDSKMIKTAKGYQIEISYQIFYAPLEVKMLTIPPLDITITRYGERKILKVPEWSFTLSPLRELAVRKDETGEYSRPDALPKLLDLEQAQTRLAVFAIFELLAALSLAYRYGYLPWGGRRPIFKQAFQRMQQLTEAELATALLIMHDAFNQLNTKPLFESNLADFFKCKPMYRSLERDFTWFFDVSQRCFFADLKLAENQEFERLLQFCKRCRVVERSH